MKITVLSENTTADERFGCEHGLSLFIEADNKKILFDMGQSSLFAENAEKLGIDLKEVDFAVLSHGHYDHGGGLATFLEINKTAPVYVSTRAFGDYYNGTTKYIGLDKALLSSDRLIFVSEDTLIDKNFTLYTCNGIEKLYPEIPSGLTEKDENGFHTDEFLHEQYIEIIENDRKVLISGCSHKGIADIVSRFRPHVLVGGFHVSKLEADDVLKQLTLTLASFNTEFYTCHCTGTMQYEFMKSLMPSLQYISVSSVTDI